jgi:hypothetical protein
VPALERGGFLLAVCRPIVKLGLLAVPELLLAVPIRCVEDRQLARLLRVLARPLGSLVRSPRPLVRRDGRRPSVQMRDSSSRGHRSHVERVRPSLMTPNYERLRRPPSWPPRDRRR